VGLGSARTRFIGIIAIPVSCVFIDYHAFEIKCGELVRKQELIQIVLVLDGRCCRSCGSAERGGATYRFKGDIQDIDESFVCCIAFLHIGIGAQAHHLLKDGLGGTPGVNDGLEEAENGRRGRRDMSRNECGEGNEVGCGDSAGRVDLRGDLQIIVNWQASGAQVPDDCIGRADNPVDDAAGVLLVREIRIPGCHCTSCISSLRAL